jgi:hypothetical protein
MDIGDIGGKSSVLTYQGSEKTDKYGIEKDLTEDSKKKTSGTINASELNIPGNKNSTLKELLAKRAAIKVQMDQFEKDLNVADEIKTHADKRDSLQKEASSHQGEVNRINGLKNDLKETYGVEDNSDEQKNLELLEKQIATPEALTTEERDKIKNMGELSEYQEAALEYDAMAGIWQDRADQAMEDSINEDKSIEGIKLGLLKTHPMLDAKKEAEGILKKTDDEIQVAILDELKNKVNENLDIDPDKSILTELQSLVDNKKVTEEDVKGLAVDEKA